MKRENATRPVNEIYNDLAQNGFPEKKLNELLEEGYFERELWLAYKSDPSREASLLACFLFEQKVLRENFSFQIFRLPDTDPRIPTLLGNALSGSLDSSLSFKVRSICLCLLVNAALSLDNQAVQRAVQPVVSILVWRHLIPAYREELFGQSSILKKRYKSRVKALENAEGQEKTRMQLECDFLASLALEVITLLNTSRSDPETVRYCSRALEFFNVLLSQFPTRRYTYYLLQDVQLICNIRLSSRFQGKMQSDIAELRAQHALLEYYMTFPYDNINGKRLDSSACQTEMDSRVTKLQRLAFTDFKDSLMLLALSSHSSITKSNELHEHLRDLPDDQLEQLCNKLHLRTTFDTTSLSKVPGALLRAYLTQYFQTFPNISIQMLSQSPLPTEADLFSEHWTMLSQMAHHLPLPRLTLQYLSYDDFLYRTAQIRRASQFLEIRAAISNTLCRLAPQITYPSREIRYNGTSNNALLITPPAVVEVAPRELALNCPAFVRAEVRLNLEELPSGMRSGWHSLKKGDLLFFVHLAASDETSTSLPSTDDPEFAAKIGVRAIRTATVDSVLTADGKPLHVLGDGAALSTAVKGNRLIRVFFDRIAYAKDTADGKLEDVYDSLNIVIKRSNLRLP